MKYSRVRPVSFAAVLSPLAALAVSSTAVLHVRGVEVPFTERVISTTAHGANSVFAIDVDGDGDIDVLSASQTGDKIAWYESDGGSPRTFTERVISSTADGATSVFATDVDGDGDTDVLSASFGDGKIVWYENTAPISGFCDSIVRLVARCVANGRLRVTVRTNLPQGTSLSITNSGSDTKPLRSTRREEGKLPGHTKLASTKSA